MKKTDTLPKGYQNNPFYVATDGLDLLFKKAQLVGIMLAIVSGLILISSLPGNFGLKDGSSPQTGSPDSNGLNIPQELIVGLVLAGIAVLLVFLFLGILLSGVSDYTSAQLARGKKTSLSESLRAVFSNFWSYAWMSVILGVKVLLWGLLFIVPGFVMAYRYSLSGVSFFDKKLRGNAAVKHSSSLTKGAWLTTYASQNLLNMITLGSIPSLLGPGTKAVLYRQLVDIGDKRPKAHALSWVTLILPMILTILIATLAIWAVVNYAGSSTQI